MAGITKIIVCDWRPTTLLVAISLARFFERNLPGVEKYLLLSDSHCFHCQITCLKSLVTREISGITFNNIPF